MTENNMNADSLIKETEAADQAECKGFPPLRHCNSNQGEPNHVHEIQALTDSAGSGKDAHTHRLIAITSDPQSIGNNDHVHFVLFKSDFHGSFFHEGWATTGGACNVGNGHVHFLNGITTLDDGHWHRYQIATSLDGVYGG